MPTTQRKPSIALSLPTRGGWIEISAARIVKKISLGPSPHGEGGLKFSTLQYLDTLNGSLPTRGGWIEIWANLMTSGEKVVPPHTGRVD